MAQETPPLTKGERTRERILENAADLFAEKGYTAVTMKDVCEATGLSRGAGDRDLPIPHPDRQAEALSRGLPRPVRL